MQKTWQIGGNIDLSVAAEFCLTDEKDDIACVNVNRNVNLLMPYLTATRYRCFFSVADSTAPSPPGVAPILLRGAVASPKHRFKLTLHFPLRQKGKNGRTLNC